MNRWLALLLFVLLFWATFFSAWFGLYGTGTWVGIVFGLSVICTLYSVGVTVAEDAELRRRRTTSVGLDLALSLRWVMAILSIVALVIFIIVDGVRLFS